MWPWGGRPGGLDFPFTRSESGQERLQDSVGGAPEFMRADPVKRDLPRLGPFGECPHFLIMVVGVEIGDAYVEDLFDLPLVAPP